MHAFEIFCRSLRTMRARARRGRHGRRVRAATAYQVYNQPVARAGTVESIRQVDAQKWAPGAGAVVGG